MNPMVGLRSRDCSRLLAIAEGPEFSIVQHHLACGERLAQLRVHGIVLVDSLTGLEEVVCPRVVEALDPEDAYDLVLVVMRKNQALQILP